MSTYSTNDMKPGVKVLFDGDPYAILENEYVKPGKGQAFNRLKIRNLKNGRVIEKTMRSAETAEAADIVELEMQYLYNDGDHYYFMDTSTYEQINISSEALGDSKNYLVADAIIRVEFYDVEPVGIELPVTVDLLVKETVPGIKGATASAQVKPATLETGLVVQVPPFVNEGDKIRVNTETGEYQSRA